MNKVRIDVIQYLRGVAALAVALSHISSMQSGLPPDTHFLPEFMGFWGVDVFFVISGFIMVHITQETPPGRLSASVFMLKRIVRIVPAYWFFTLLAFISHRSHWVGGQSVPMDFTVLLKSMFFLDLGFPVLFVGWTLSLEMFFYLIFALGILLFRHQYRVVIVVFFLVALTIIPAFTDMNQRYAYFYTQTMLLEFVAGMLIAQFYTKTRLYIGVIAAWSILLTGCAFLVIVIELKSPSIMAAQRVLWWGVPAALMVFGALHVGAVREIKLLRGLGAVSYSLYLCHIPCFYISAILVSMFFAGQGWILWAYFLMVLAMTSLVTMMSWLVLERLSQRVLLRAAGIGL